MSLIATIISRLFEPTVVIGIIAVLAGYKAGLRGNELLLYDLFLLFIIVGPILVTRWWMLKTKRVGDWDIKERSQRIKPLIALTAITIIDYFLFLVWQVQLFNQLLILFAVWLVGFSLITTRWKISGHAGISAFGAGIIVQWFGWQWWPVLLIVPLVAWARVIRRDHTVAQVVAGAFYSWVLLVVFDYLIIG